MHTTDPDAGTASRPRRVSRARNDLVTLAIVFSAILLFVGIGGRVVPESIASLLGDGSGPSPVLVSALMLNIALLIFGWRRYVELSREVQERRKAEQLARDLAETDALTGTLNRRSVAPATDALITACRQRGQTTAFLMVDLDNFKTINDVNGHMMGDELLKTVARRMAALLPHDGILARLGGDEFACIVPCDPKMPDRIDQLAAQLIERVAAPLEHDDLIVEVTVSVGIAGGIGPDADNADAQTLLHHADIAMYHAKKQGKNRYFWFEQSMESELRFRSELETGIRRGIRAGEFVPYYEQQVDLETGELTGFEMLARWNSPKLGLVAPDVFIPIAEDIGLIAELSENLIEQALEHAREWDPKLSLSVNISPVQLRDPWFSQKILKLLVKHNFPPQRLDIEITESCLHENVGVVRSMITSLKNQGVTISLDDFGTGYSSLEQLRSLPFDRLKIDRSFVAELASEDGNSKIISAIVSLGEGLSMPITAEGIEDTHILETLRRFGRLKGQGYLYGRPEAIEAVRQRLGDAGLLSGALDQPVAAEPADRRKAG